MKARSFKWMGLLGATFIWSVVALGQTPTGHSRLEHNHQPAAGAAVETVTLEQLVREAEVNNPAIAASKHNVDAKRAMVLPASTLPDPVFSFQHMGDLIPLRLQEGDPSSARTYGLQQEVPFPGKLGLKGKIAETEAAAEESSSEKTRRDVVVDLKAAYFDYCLIHQSIETVERDKQLLQNFSDIAQEKYRVGQGIQQDVLKAQVEISKLIEKRTSLEQKRSAFVSQINGLVYRTPGTPLGQPTPLRVPKLTYSLEQLNDLAQAAYPELQLKDREIERNRYVVNLARKNFLPDFMLGFTYYDRTVPEMYGLMLNVKVPLYFWRKQEQELAAARSTLNSARSMRDNTAAIVYAKLQESYSLAKSSEKLVQLYDHDLIPQSRLAMQSALASYQVGRVDFLTVIDSLVTLLDNELKYYEVLTEFHKALARMEPYVGIQLTP
jgi:outer membrane protein, heavy metal efflux system